MTPEENGSAVPHQTKDKGASLSELAPPSDGNSASPIPASEDPDQALWNDPLQNDEKNRSGAVLLAEDITSYVLQHNLLINRNDFKDGRNFGAKLKGASYTMTPHPTQAWILEEDPTGKVAEAPLKRGRDSEGDYYIVPKNSLVFIKLRQELRIPFYMIGRHNLKIRYVYKGLLLGTGPQVDPGYVGNLIIPLHNFTREDVLVHIEKSFVSIDFVKTTSFFQKDESIPNTKDELYFKYDKRKCLIERDKVEKRKGLANYLEGSLPRSQMGKFEYDFDRLKQETTRELLQFQETARDVKKEQIKFQTDLTRKWERSRVWKGFELVAVIGALGLILNLYRLQERDTESRGRDLENAIIATNFANYENKLENITNTVGKKFEDLATQVGTLQSNLQTNLSAAQRELVVFEMNWAHLTNNLHQVGLTNILRSP